MPDMTYEEEQEWFRKQEEKSKQQEPTLPQISEARYTTAPQAHSEEEQNYVKIFAKNKPEAATPSCPECGCTQIAPVKQGFGLGKAAIGFVAIGPLGLLGGAIGANKVKMVCMSCRHQG